MNKLKPNPMILGWRNYNPHPNKILSFYCELGWIALGRIFGFLYTPRYANWSKNLLYNICFPCKMYVLLIQDDIPLCFLVSMSFFLLILGNMIRNVYNTVHALMAPKVCLWYLKVFIFFGTNGLLLSTKTTSKEATKPELTSSRIREKQSFKVKRNAV